MRIQVRLAGGLVTLGALLAFPALRAPLDAQQYVTFRGDAPERLFKQSRDAVGGEAAVMNVTSLVLKGTLRGSGADGPPERATEIRVLWPDRYVRIESAGDWTKRTGFNGGRNLIAEIRMGETVDKPPAQATTPLLRAEKARLARTLLGIGTFVTPEVWLTLQEPRGTIEIGSAFDTSQGAVIPGGRILEAVAKDGFLSIVHFDATGIPLRVEYDANGRRVAIAFSDRRQVGNLLLPHTITTTLDGQPLEELTISEYQVNPELTKADFEKD